MREPEDAQASGRSVLAGRRLESSPLAEASDDVSRSISALLRLGWTRWREKGVDWIDLDGVHAVVCPVRVEHCWLLPPRGILSLT